MRREVQLVHGPLHALLSISGQGSRVVKVAADGGNRNARQAGNITDRRGGLGSCHKNVTGYSNRLHYSRLKLGLSSRKKREKGRNSGNS
ncbi:hypothetical protein SDC9_133452 [bioreactor metagenome]|uniref:Uncharacterized protein n=1 Tax=bioreactor metagenome TaxID=1076179 RepID=A0A645DBP0_9ZZZZ